MKKKNFLIFLFLFAVLTYGCSQQTATLDQQVKQPIEETEQIIEEPESVSEKPQNLIP